MNSCGTGRGPSRRPSRAAAGGTWGSRACAVGAGRGGRGRSGARRVPGRDLARQRCSCRSHCSRCRREVRCRRLSPSSDCHRRTDGRTDAMPRSHRPPPAAQRSASAAGNAAEPKPEGGSLATTFKIFLLFAGLMVKVPVGLYFSCKLLLFQSLLLMSPDDSGFYATIVAVVGLHVVLSVFVFVVWKEGLPDWREKNE